MATGVAFVPAERGLRGTISPMNVRENLTITDVRRFVKGMRLSRKSEVDETIVWIQRLSVRTASTESPIGSLSGGNQQKVMFGKALRLSPRLLLLDEPTQGVDIGAKDQIHSLVEKAAAEGVATLDRVHRHRRTGAPVQSGDRPGRRSCGGDAHGRPDHGRDDRAHTTADHGETLMIKRLGLDRYSALYLWGFFIVVFTALEGRTFLSTTSAKTILIENVIVGVLAIAFLVPLTTGTYDLSIGDDDDDVAGDHELGRQEHRMAAGLRDAARAARVRRRQGSSAASS